MATSREIREKSSLLEDSNLDDEILPESSSLDTNKAEKAMKKEDSD